MHGPCMATALDLTPALEKALLKAMKDGNSDVRTAAYHAIGTLVVKKAKTPIKKRLTVERSKTLAMAQWAYEQLGAIPTRATRTWTPSSAS